MKAIGVFDSGVGGITVLRALRQRFPHERFIYLADTARLPYGSKSPETIRKYVEQNVRFLLRHQVKAIIVACNSASTAILEDPIDCPVPLFNVVEPGARKAVELSASGKIGILGTRATVNSEAYSKSIRRLLSHAQVYQQACPLLVPLVEEGWLDDPITNLITYRYVAPLLQFSIDTLVLGCTHYPALSLSIQKVTGQSVQLIDSSIGLIDDLVKHEICDVHSGGGGLEFKCTDFSPRLKETVGLLLGPTQLDSLEVVNTNE